MLGVIPAAIALIRGKPTTAAAIFVVAVGLVIFTSQGATHGTCRLGCLIRDLP
ncbi:MAG: hypothetical protein ABR592_01975 [Nitriliruptorales bacterium]